MPSALGRLRGIFKAPRAAVISRGTPITAQNATAAVITKQTTTSDIPMSKTLRRLRNMVETFKKSSESPEFRDNRRNFYKIVRRLAACKQFPMIVDVLEYQKKFEDVTNEEFLVRTITCYGKAGMFEHARKLFDEISELNCTPTTRSFNALLFACIDAAKFEEVEGLFRRLPDQLGITLDVVSYNIIIKAFCEMGNADSGVSVLEEMEMKGVEPNLISFNTLLNGFYGNKRFADGEKIWALMESKNVIPNVRSYNARIRGLLSEERADEAIELFHDMERKGIVADVVSHNEVIRWFCKEGNAEEVKKWHGKLRESACKPDRVTFLTVIPFFCLINELDIALELCKEAITMEVNLGAAIFQTVLDGLVNRARVEEANDLLEFGKSKRYFWYELKLNVPLVE